MLTPPNSNRSKFPITGVWQSIIGCGVRIPGPIRPLQYLQVASPPAHRGAGDMAFATGQPDVTDGRRQAKASRDCPITQEDACLGRMPRYVQLAELVSPVLIMAESQPVDDAKEKSELNLCDDRRPRCTSCTLSNEECRFASPGGIPAGTMAQRDALAVQMQEALKRDGQLLTIFEAIRGAEGEQLEDILRRIRNAESLEDFLETVADASLLLPPVQPHRA
ncbi:c6 transcription factor [Fusarium albosuccineum]|uniref:C6 transcription factor n=1 Tax=Fusarium albosuccineum TaxID=1237068 RepID=A0A8H4PDN3_9HYPO|nr:c6 transcription factor [Fusarium albosuccineum]